MLFLIWLPLHPSQVDQVIICQQYQRSRFHPWVGKIPWRRERLPTPMCLPGEFHGQRSLEGYSPWDLKEWDTTERLTHTTTRVDGSDWSTHTFSLVRGKKIAFPYFEITWQQSWILYLWKDADFWWENNTDQNPTPWKSKGPCSNLPSVILPNFDSINYPNLSELRLTFKFVNSKDVL